MKKQYKSANKERKAADGKNSAFCTCPCVALGRSRVLHSAFLSGFTLVELMIATAMFGMIMGGAIGVFVMCRKLWHATSLDMTTSRDGSMALSRLVYGVGSDNGLRTASSISTNEMKGM